MEFEINIGLRYSKPQIVLKDFPFQHPSTSFKPGLFSILVVVINFQVGKNYAVVGHYRKS